MYLTMSMSKGRLQSWTCALQMPHVLKDKINAILLEGAREGSGVWKLSNGRKKRGWMMEYTGDK